MIGVACAAALALTGCDSITPAPIEYHDPDVARPAPNSVDAPSVAVGLNDAGYDIFHAVAANSDGDVVLSPISIGLAFGMLDLGASGSVADALDTLFQYPVAGDARWSAFNTLQQETVRDPGPQPTPTSTTRHRPARAPDRRDREPPLPGRGLPGGSRVRGGPAEVVRRRHRTLRDPFGPGGRAPPHQRVGQGPDARPHPRPHSGGRHRQIPPTWYSSTRSTSRRRGRLRSFPARPRTARSRDSTARPRRRRSCTTAS